jgi:hypothetical protein
MRDERRGRPVGVVVKRERDERVAVGVVALAEERDARIDVQTGRLGRDLVVCAAFAGADRGGLSGLPCPRLRVFSVRFLPVHAAPHWRVPGARFRSRLNILFMTDGEDRAARNEALFREVNERIEELGNTPRPGGELSLICECADEACIERVSVDRDTYGRTRSDARCFLLVPGHERAELERVVERGDVYVIVRKHGEAGVIAEQNDPRD